MNKTTHPYFVPNGDDRKQTAVLLVGTADEYGIDQREIRTARGGFRISENVANALGLDGAEPEPEADGPEPEADGAEPEADGAEPEPETETETEADGAEPEPEPAKRTRKPRNTN